MKWKEDKKEEYKFKLGNFDNKDTLSDIMNKLDCENITESIIDDCVNDLNNVILSAGVSHQVNPVNESVVKSSNLWYDAECRERLEDFKRAECMYRMSGCEFDRVAMCDARSLYRKCCRVKRRERK